MWAGCSQVALAHDACSTWGWEGTVFSKSRVKLGSVHVGGSAPVVVQSMTNTRTHDVEATLGQIRALTTAGAEIVRIAVPDQAAVQALPELMEGSPVPLVADVHFDYRLAVDALKAGIPGIRINPGNIGDESRVSAVVEAAAEHNAVLRVGVNSGSLHRDLRDREAEDPIGVLVESAERFCAAIEAQGFLEMKVSVKSSSPMITVEANRMLAPRIPYPIHIGVTEAGTPWAGTIRSAVALGTLLAEGIGDTLRVSLTGDPVEEVRVGKEILRSVGLVSGGPRVVSCPTCGRTQVDLETLALEVEKRVRELSFDIEVAVMGCAVNGPGEARKADFGIAGGRGTGVIFRQGEPVKKVDQTELVDALMEEIDKWLQEKEGPTAR